MSAKLTKVATLALPLAVKEFDDGEYGWEIGPRGLLAWDVGCRSFDEAEGAARTAAERLEKDMLERYADAASTIPTDHLQPGAVKALVDACGALLATLKNHRTPLNVSELSAVYSVRNALAPFAEGGTTHDGESR